MVRVIKRSSLKGDVTCRLVKGIPMDEDINREIPLFLVDKRLSWIHILTPSTLVIEPIKMDPSTYYSGIPPALWRIGSDYYDPPSLYSLQIAPKSSVTQNPVASHGAPLLTNTTSSSRVTLPGCPIESSSVPVSNNPNTPRSLTSSSNVISSTSITFFNDSSTSTNTSSIGKPVLANPSLSTASTSSTTMLSWSKQCSASTGTPVSLPVTPSGTSKELGLMTVESSSSATEASINHCNTLHSGHMSEGNNHKTAADANQKAAAGTFFVPVSGSHNERPDTAGFGCLSDHITPESYQEALRLYRGGRIANVYKFFFPSTFEHSLTAKPKKQNLYLDAWLDQASKIKAKHREKCMRSLIMPNNMDDKHALSRRSAVSGFRKKRKRELFEQSDPHNLSGTSYKKTGSTSDSPNVLLPWKKPKYSFPDSLLKPAKSQLQSNEEVLPTSSFGKNSLAVKNLVRKCHRSTYSKKNEVLSSSSISEATAKNAKFHNSSETARLAVSSSFGQGRALQGYHPANFTRLLKRGHSTSRIKKCRKLALSYSRNARTQCVTSKPKKSKPLIAHGRDTTHQSVLSSPEKCKSHLEMSVSPKKDVSPATSHVEMAVSSRKDVCATTNDIEMSVRPQKNVSAATSHVEKALRSPKNVCAATNQVETSVSPHRDVSAATSHVEMAVKSPKDICATTNHVEMSARSRKHVSAATSHVEMAVRSPTDVCATTNHVEASVKPQKWKTIRDSLIRWREMQAVPVISLTQPTSSESAALLSPTNSTFIEASQGEVLPKPTGSCDSSSKPREMPTTHELFSDVAIKSEDCVPNRSTASDSSLPKISQKATSGALSPRPTTHDNTINSSTESGTVQSTLSKQPSCCTLFSRPVSTPTIRDSVFSNQFLHFQDGTSYLIGQPIVKATKIPPIFSDPEQGTLRCVYINSRYVLSKIRKESSRCQDRQTSVSPGIKALNCNSVINTLMPSKCHKLPATLSVSTCSTAVSKSISSPTLPSSQVLTLVQLPDHPQQACQESQTCASNTIAALETLTNAISNSTSSATTLIASEGNTVSAKKVSPNIDKASVKVKEATAADNSQCKKRKLQKSATLSQETSFSQTANTVHVRTPIIDILKNIDNELSYSSSESNVLSTKANMVSTSILLPRKPAQADEWQRSTLNPEASLSYSTYSNNTPMEVVNTLPMIAHSNQGSSITEDLQEHFCKAPASSDMLQDLVSTQQANNFRETVLNSLLNVVGSSRSASASLEHVDSIAMKHESSEKDVLFDWTKVDASTGLEERYSSHLDPSSTKAAIGSNRLVAGATNKQVTTNEPSIVWSISSHGTKNNFDSKESTRKQKNDLTADSNWANIGGVNPSCWLEGDSSSSELFTKPSFDDGFSKNASGSWLTKDSKVRLSTNALGSGSENIPNETCSDVGKGLDSSKAAILKGFSRDAACVSRATSRIIKKISRMRPMTNYPFQIGTHARKKATAINSRKEHLKSNTNYHKRSQWMFHADSKLNCRPRQHTHIPSRKMSSSESLQHAGQLMPLAKKSAAPNISLDDDGITVTEQKPVSSSVLSVQN